MFLVLQLPAFPILGFTDSGFFHSWFHRIPAFLVPDFTDSVFFVPSYKDSGFIVPDFGRCFEVYQLCSLFTDRCCFFNNPYLWRMMF
jgi:hypothetical protein